MANELFRQQERLTAAKLNRLLAGVGGSTDSGGGLALGGTISGAYTMDAADADTWLVVDSAGASTITAPSEATAAIGVDSVIAIERRGAGAVTVVADSGATLTKPSDANATLNAQGSIAYLRKVSTNGWALGGDLTTADAAITDAPSDGTYYARRNGVWTAITGALDESIVSLRAGSDQSIPHDTNTIVTAWNSAPRNDGSRWSSGDPSKITAISGDAWMKLRGFVSWESVNAGTGRNIALLLNGSVVAGHFSPQFFGNCGVFLETDWMAVVAGDYGQMRVYHDRGSALALRGPAAGLTGYSYFGASFRP